MGKVTPAVAGCEGEGSSWTHHGQVAQPAAAAAAGGGDWVGVEKYTVDGR